MKKILATLLGLFLVFTPLLSLEAKTVDEEVYNYFWVNKTANIRAQPGMAGKVIGGVHKDESVYVLTKHNGWCEIEWDNYKTGYVYCDLLEEDIMPYPYDADSDYEYDYSDDYSADDFDSFWPDTSSPAVACSSETEICSGHFQISVSGYMTDKGHDRQDLNLHVNGDFNLQNPGNEMMSMNINGSMGSMEDAIQGSMQAVTPPEQIFVKFENMQGGEILGEFPIAQNKWFSSPNGSSALSMTGMGGMGNSLALQDLFPTSVFIDSSASNGTTEFHYQVPVSLDNLRNLGSLMLSSRELSEIESVKPEVTLDYWVNDNNMLTKLTATAHFSDPAEESNEAQIEFSLKISAINQPIEIMLPIAEATLPFPSDLMF